MILQPQTYQIVVNANLGHCQSFRVQLLIRPALCYESASPSQSRVVEQTIQISHAFKLQKETRNESLISRSIYNSGSHDPSAHVSSPQSADSRYQPLGRGHFQANLISGEVRLFGTRSRTSFLPPLRHSLRDKNDQGSITGKIILKDVLILFLVPVVLF